MDHKELQKLIKELLNYDPLTGIFTWKKHTGSVHKGAVAGSRCKVRDKSIIRITIDSKIYLAHRLAWLYMTGDYPAKISHFGDSTDNSFFNLFILNNNLNTRNKKLSPNNNTGLNGVMYDPQSGKYHCSFKTPDDKLLKRIFYTMLDATSWRISRQNEFGHY